MIVSIPLTCARCQRNFRIPLGFYCLQCNKPLCSDCLTPEEEARGTCGCPIEESVMYKAGQKMATEYERRFLEAILK